MLHLVVHVVLGLDFTVIGDWGGMPYWPYYTPGEASTAKALGKKAGEVNSSFTLALGDNVTMNSAPGTFLLWHSCAHACHTPPAV